MENLLLQEKMQQARILLFGKSWGNMTEVCIIMSDMRD